MVQVQLRHERGTTGCRMQSAEHAAPWDPVALLSLKQYAAAAVTVSKDLYAYSQVGRSQSRRPACMQHTAATTAAGVSPLLLWLKALQHC